MTAAPHFATTHSEYLWLTAQLFGEFGAMQKAVWDQCEPDVQESMLEQLRKPLREQRELSAKYEQIRGGDVW